MTLRPLSFVLVVLALAGCQTAPGPPPPPAPPPPTPPHNEFAWSQAAGDNTILGQGVWRHEGRRFTCADKLAELTPTTPYTRQRMVQLYGSDQKAVRSVAEVKARFSAQPGRDYRSYIRTTTCDAQGRFSFRDLPAGAWFVIAHGATRDGGDALAMQRVDVFGGASRSVRLGE